MKVKLVTGFSILTIIIAFVFIGPLIYRVNPNEINMLRTEAQPSSLHLLGTDGTGRDILARLMSGGKVSLTVGIFATSLKLAVVLILGFFSGFIDKLDSLIMRLCDIFMCFPFYILALSIAGITGPSIRNLVVIIAFFTFAVPTRLVRTEIRTLKDMEFIQVLKLNNEKYMRILLNHIIPNLSGTVLVIYTTSVAQAILMETSLSFLGMGVQEPQASWGSMLSVTLDVLNIQNRWWLWLPAGILVLSLIFSINLIGEGLKDDRSKKSKH